MNTELTVQQIADEANRKYQEKLAKRDTLEQLARRYKVLKEGLGLSVQDIAELTGMNRSTINTHTNLEHHRKPLEKLIAALEAKFEEGLNSED